MAPAGPGALGQAPLLAALRCADSVAVLLGHVSVHVAPAAAQEPAPPGAAPATPAEERRRRQERLSGLADGAADARLNDSWSKVRPGL